jgi:AraC-like DNA-binding protein
MLVPRLARRPLAHSPPHQLAPRGIDLTASVDSTGFEVQDRSPYDWHGLKRSSTDSAWVLWQYTLAGEGRLTWEGRTQPVRPGTAMVLVIPHDHRNWLPPGGRWQHFYLSCSGATLVAAWQSVIARRGPLFALAPDHPLVDLAAATCCDALDGRLRSPWAASAAGYRLAMAMYELAHGEPADTTLPPAIARARDLAQARACDGLGVDDLAAAAGLSRHHFTRRFTAALGLSPGVYLEERRLERASELLRDRALTVAEVARRCGYADPAYFCRAFRRRRGSSPDAWRQRMPA